MGEAMSRRVRGVFNAANFWAIVLYNVLSLNSLEFAKLVGGRLVLKGNKGVSSLPSGNKNIKGIFCFLSQKDLHSGALGDPHRIILAFNISPTQLLSFKLLPFSPHTAPSPLSGFPLSTLSVLFVTYCGVQLVKERERRQALLDEPEPVDGGKKKAE